MLFNSFPFIFYFLPITFILILIFNRFSKSIELRNVTLLMASLIFYGYWNISFLPLLISSIILNYSASLLINRNILARKITILMVCLNIICLLCFKYLLFFSQIFISDDNIPVFIRTIILPIGISFFTFQQIAYIVDVYKKRVNIGSLMNYSLFVSFFPQLIAGPIIRYKQMFNQLNTNKPLQKYLFQGIFLFIIGLFKKVVIADSFATQADTIFNRAEEMGIVNTLDAWLGALSFSFQIYFDFSAYSDMAIGIGLMFGFILPVNFNSPYKALSVIEFWRRWHVTLSSFFRDYIYIPMGGNRYGIRQQILLLFFVMLLVGLWHGAAWTFLIWGLYHGFLLSIFHVYKNFCIIIGDKSLTILKKIKNLKHLPNFIHLFFTFNLITVGWVIFRSPDIAVALTFIEAMFSLSDDRTIYLLQTSRYVMTISLIFLGAFICFTLPNSMQLINLNNSINSLFHDEATKVKNVKLSWLNFDKKKPAIVIFLLVIMFYFAITSMLEEPVEFLYFQF